MMITIMAGDQHNDFVIVTSMMITILVISIVTIIIVPKAEGREVPQCSFVGNDWWPEPGRWPAIHLSCFSCHPPLPLIGFGKIYLYPDDFDSLFFCFSQI